jgi:hypothetical protein
VRNGNAGLNQDLSIRATDIHLLDSGVSFRPMTASRNSPDGTRHYQMKYIGVRSIEGELV